MTKLNDLIRELNPRSKAAILEFVVLVLAAAAIVLIRRFRPVQVRQLNPDAPTQLQQREQQESYDRAVAGLLRSHATGANFGEWWN